MLKQEVFNHRYRVTEILGAGAQGQVMLAIDTVVDRQVALKVLHVGQDDNWRALFKREFEILADLSHPYLAQVYDFGVTADETVYFTRDYIPGKDLLSATDGCSIPQFVALSVQLCRALRPLHRSGLIHGDIKPGNLVLGPLQSVDGHAWRCTAHPIDFSFVRAAHGQSPPRGTLQYMAPELLSQQPIDVRADLYGLGVSLFQALTGRCPFTPDVAAILDAHQKGVVPEFETIRVRVESEEDTQILSALKPILLRLLAGDPKKRYPDLDELEAAFTGLKPAAVVTDNISAIPSRNVLATREGFSKSIWENVNKRLTANRHMPLHVIQGEVGSGRSALRKVVKWQSQLNGFNVAEVDASGATGFFTTMANLLTQFSMLMGGTEDGDVCARLASRLNSLEYTKAEIAPACAEVATLSAACAAMKPLLITVDNVNRADADTLMALRGIIAESSERVPMAVLATATADFSWQDALGPGEKYEIVALSETEISSLIKRYLRIEGAPAASKIIAHTGGNPLIVTQLLCDCITTSKSPDSLLEQTVVSDVNGYWQQKLTELPYSEMCLLKACAVLNRPSSAECITRVAEVPEGGDALIKQLCDTRWLTKAQNLFAIRSAALAAQIVSNISSDERTQYARRAFDAEVGAPYKILHAAACGELDYVNQHALNIVVEREKSGAPAVAREIALAVVKCDVDAEMADELRLILGRLHIALGELESARDWLSGLEDCANQSLRQSTLKYLGRLEVLQSSFEKAAVLLRKALALDENGIAAPSILYEICEIEFRRGRYDVATEIANRGLDLHVCDGETACNLLCSKAKASAARGKHDVAIALADEAVERATSLKEKRLLAFARDVRAWVLSLQGKMMEATEELERCVVLYREVGDLARLARSLQVVGNNYWWLERWELMLKKHEEAMRVVASLDNPAARNEQLIAYGFALNCIGRFEKAALVLRQAEAEAKRLGDAFQQAKVAVYEGDMHAWQGNNEKALACWEQGYEGFGELSNYGLLAELCLEIAGALASIDQPASLPLAENWVRKARSYHREDLGRRFDELLLLTEGQLLLAKNEYQKGFSTLSELIDKKADMPNKQLKWQAHLFIAEAQIKNKMSVLARKQLREAEHLLLRLSERFSIADQKSFWQDARRARVRALLEQAESEQVYDSEQIELQPESCVEAEKLYRVLEFNKRISKETELGQLTSEILDAAIELTGAERGFFLVKEAEGLTARAERDISANQSQSPETQFSSSIAESVYLDNESVLTVDAARDPRFNEFLSIHHLQIKSVACLPIAYRNNVMGVLYLENRLARGKFDHGDMKMLSAFCDQMAIALAHAKAIEEINQVRQNLEETTLRLQELVDRQTADLRSKEASLELAQEQLHRIKMRVSGSGSYHGLIGAGEQMQRVFAVIERVKNNDIPVVIVGESGTGKDAIAKVIHEVGTRQRGPFVSLPCGAIPENLVESTLFGHRQGAFSGAQSDASGLFESAAGGTLYLDDLAEMPKRMQVDLLRVLQEGAFSPLGDHRKIRADFRLLCSSKVPLEQLVEQGLLRADLFYRLQVITIQLPPLRQRNDDIPLLAGSIAKREAQRLELPDSALEAATLKDFMQRPWPGNIREMEQEIRRILIIGDDHTGIYATAAHGSEVEIATERRGSHRNSKKEKEQILEALERHQWNKSKAAVALGMPRRTFYRRLKHFDIV
ncbi:MAG: sigma 54-interacting transcriptional regulator [Deltaproteobacteria bacterium]|nr:sigma 54-interacting transcriptional regulator [Deltaproteobacteria bacterium]MBN2673498.1 sigma 54-interacting transcriptional regulator [Deltaproteobacteria bacterium]